MMNVEDFKKSIHSLTAEKLDVSKCTNALSFYHQILHNSNRRQNSEERQTQQFNLANGRVFHNPIEAATVLLEREYGRTFLFNNEKFVESIFIPPVFVSKLYKSDVSVLEYNVVDYIKRAGTTLGETKPDFWFTQELSTFLQLHTGKEITNGDYDIWMVKIKCIHLIREKGPPPPGSTIATVAIPTISLGPDELLPFAQFCVAYLEQCDSNHHFTKAFKQHSNKEKRLRRWLINTLHSNPLGHNSSMRWLFKVNQLDVSGELPEHYLYDELKEIFGDEGWLKDEKFVILHATDVSLVDGRSNKSCKPSQKEFDFLLFSAVRKLIIAIEAKRSLPVNPFKQLKEYQEIFEEGLGDQLDAEWTFYPVLYIHEPPNDLQNGVNSNHSIHPETDMKTWLKNVFGDHHTKPCCEQQSIEQLKNVLKIMVFTLQVSKSSLQHVDKTIKDESPVGTVVHSKWPNYIAKAIEAVSTADNIIFYSNYQIPIFLNDDPKNRKVILHGCFGSGKTFLLREKAEILAADHNEKVLFVIGTSYEKKTLLQLTLEHKWSAPKYNGNIRVLNKSDIMKSDESGVITPKHLLDLLENGREHLFIDEWEPGKWTRELNRELCKASAFNDQCFWIAFHRKDSFLLDLPFTRNKNMYDLTNTFQIVQLEYSMRNSKAIINYSHRKERATRNVYTHRMLGRPPYNLPNGLNPKKQLADEAFDCIVDVTKTEGVLVVNLFKFDDDAESRATELTSMFKHFRQLKSTMEIGAYFCGKEMQSIEASPEINIVDASECLSYLTEKHGVLIADEEAVEGFEWKTVFVSTQVFRMKSNIFMRCISNLIITDKYPERM